MVVVGEVVATQFECAIEWAVPASAFVAPNDGGGVADIGAGAALGSEGVERSRKGTNVGYAAVGNVGSQ